MMHGPLNIRNIPAINVLLFYTLPQNAVFYFVDGFLLGYIFIKERMEYSWKNGLQYQPIYIKI